MYNYFSASGNLRREAYGYQEPHGGQWFGRGRGGRGMGRGRVRGRDAGRNRGSGSHKYFNGQGICNFNRFLVHSKDTITFCNTCTISAFFLDRNDLLVPF